MDALVNFDQGDNKQNQKNSFDLSILNNNNNNNNNNPFNDNDDLFIDNESFDNSTTTTTTTNTTQDTNLFIDENDNDEFDIFNRKKQINQVNNKEEEREGGGGVELINTTNYIKVGDHQDDDEEEKEKDEEEKEVEIKEIKEEKEKKAEEKVEIKEEKDEDEDEIIQISTTPKIEDFIDVEYQEERIFVDEPIPLEPPKLINGIPDFILDRWEKDYKNLLLTGSANEVVDGEAAIYGLPIQSTVRGLFWKVMLGTLSKSSRDQWLDQTRKQRTKYDTLKRGYIIDPRNAKENIDIDPLSQNKDSIWNQFFENETTQKEIGHDITRTYPDLPFFERLEIQDTMTRILFIFSRQYPKIKYLQGMNEILAPIVFAIYVDSHWGDYRHAYKQTPRAEDARLEPYYPTSPIPYYCPATCEEESNELGHVLRDARFYEHDAYFVFEALMAIVGKWFTSPPNSPLPPPRLSGARKELYDLSEREASDAAANIVVVEQCHSIFQTLGVVDSHLHAYLKGMGIEPHLYSLRWVRILLAQVFPLHSLLILWDAIFKNGIELLTFICISMMLSIKDTIIDRDYSDCLQILFNYPIVQDPSATLFTAYTVQEKINTMIAEEGPKALSNIYSKDIEIETITHKKVAKSTTKQQPSSSVGTSPIQPVSTTTTTTVSSPTLSSSSSSLSSSGSFNTSPIVKPSTKVSIPTSSQPLPQQYNHQQQQIKQQQQLQSQQQSSFSIFSSITSTVKQMINEFSEMEPSREIERLKETQTHAATRIERLMFALETVKTNENMETIQSVQDELTAIKRMLITNNTTNISPSSQSPIIQGSTKSQSIAKHNEIMNQHQHQQQQKLLAQKNAKVQQLQHFNVPNMPIFEEDLVEVYSESLLPPDHPDHPNNINHSTKHLEEDVTEEELNYMSKLSNNLGF